MIKDEDEKIKYILLFYFPFNCTFSYNQLFYENTLNFEIISLQKHYVMKKQQLAMITWKKKCDSFI